MATSQENKTAGSTTHTAGLCSRQSVSSSHQYYASLVQARDNSILPAKESIPQSSCTCYQLEGRKTDIHGSSRGSGRPHHGDHNHDCRISNRNFKDQNRARPTISKQQITNEPKRNTSAHCASNTAEISSNEQHITQENSSEILSRSPTKTTSKLPRRISEPTLSESAASNALSSSNIDKRITSGDKMSKIPLLTSARRSIFPKQDTTNENFTQITNDQEYLKSFETGLNHDNEQKLLVIPDPSDCVDVLHMDMIEQYGEEETNNDVIYTENFRTNMAEEEEVRVDLTCTGTLQFDALETRDEEKINIPSSTNSYARNLSLSEKHQSDTYQENAPDKTDTLNSHQNNFNDENFIAFKQEQNEDAAYFDSYANIDDATNETSEDIKKAEAFTELIISHLPSGNANKMDTVCHVLYNDINSKDRPLVLKLNSSEGLGNIKHVKSEQDDLKLAQILIDIIQRNQSHPVLEDIIERLSKVHGVDKKYISIKTVYVGTFNIVYTVIDLPSHIIESITKPETKLKSQFKQFVSLKIHSLLYRPSFDIAYFDKRGHKNFPNESKTYEVGPPECMKLYTTPAGWIRYGLKVLGKYPNDNWLHPFKHPRNWYRAFHGTGHAQSQDFDDKNQLSDKLYACVDALSSIYLNDFHKARKQWHGEGVYCSPNPTFPETRYVGSVPLDTRHGKKTFKCMLQVAVNPDGVTFTKNDDIWVVRNPKDIRPYGILIKEV